MSSLPFPCPSPPAWAVDWQVLAKEFQWIRALRDCPQDSVFHGEGTVWTHVQMVCEALAALEEFRALPAAERQIVFAAALLHDVAKTACTRQEDGRVTSPGHSQRGAIAARSILWDLGVDFAVREHICALVRYHQRPFHLINRPDSARTAFLISQTARCSLLALLAKADALGRDCADTDRMLLNVELFREHCRDLKCYENPRRFPSDLSRFLYFRTPGRDPDYLAYGDAKCEVTVMSGLPGSGKDGWITQHLPDRPQVSLDAIREEVGAAPTRNQGAVIQAARERARELLRIRQDFAWNATNLSREIRAQVVNLLASYNARISIVYVEVGRDALLDRNRARSAAVPLGRLERMMDRWEVPDPTEAHQVEWWVDGAMASIDPKPAG
jgi:predicted kinase